MQRTRSINLSQGSALAINHQIKSCLPHEIDQGFCFALVVSHSCDIANSPDIEPEVEVILGVFKKESDGNYEHGKNPRTLHLTVRHEGGDKVIELQARNKISVSKHTLSQILPNIFFQLQPKGIKVLQSWLSTRYRRHAFPDEFNRRIKEIIKYIANEGRKHNKAILGIWFNLEPERELNSDEPYELDIFVVYSSDNPGYEEEAEGLVRKIKDKFGSINSGIYLGKCKAYSEMEFTYHDMRTNYEYQFEHISIREEGL